MFRDAAHDLLPDLVALRRRLHRDPEVGLHLPRTQQVVLEALADLDLEITRGRALSSVTAVLRGARPGPTVLLRADMDALPIAEETGLEFAASGATMHACGHDLHTAGLIGAARLLAGARDRLSGDVVFLFQPGEEGDDGAALMIAEGALEASGTAPVAAYAAHVVPGERGVFRTRPGVLMAGISDLRIEFHGVGGHGSQPHEAIDPVVGIGELVTALQVMVTRRFPVFDPVVITVTQLAGSDAINVIPERASLGATVRTLSRLAEKRVQGLVRELADGIATAHGCRAVVTFSDDYPALINDEVEAEWARETLAETFGDTRSLLARDPLMASEDFSRVLEAVPGAFVLLSATPAELDPAVAAWNHSARVVFDDGVLGDLAAALATLAARRLDRAAPLAP